MDGRRDKASTPEQDALRSSAGTQAKDRHGKSFGERQRDLRVHATALGRDKVSDPCCWKPPNFVSHRLHAPVQFTILATHQPDGKSARPPRDFLAISTVAASEAGNGSQGTPAPNQVIGTEGRAD